MTVSEDPGRVRGSTTIDELLRRWPDGRAMRLMSRLHWACAYCGGRTAEPLTMAAVRHANDPHLVLECFRALDSDEGPPDDLVEAAAEKHHRPGYGRR
ncbi:MAG: hypothetical protein ACRDN9_00840 [Streptosporangiaceae bacterium]